MASTSKRIFVYRFDRQPAEAIIDPVAGFQAARLEVLTPEGTFVGVNYTELKAVCFVSEAASPDLFDVHPFFERRPKAPGLWTRFTFRDGTKVDGILPHNLLDWPDYGYFMTPPHAGTHRHRVFIPRLALIQTELRGVVGAAGAEPQKKASAASLDRQLPMFE